MSIESVHPEDNFALTPQNAFPIYRFLFVCGCCGLELSGDGRGPDIPQAQKNALAYVTNSHVYDWADPAFPRCTSGNIAAHDPASYRVVSHTR